MTGTTTAIDSSDNSHDGTVNGAILNGSYYAFDGVDDYVSLPSLVDSGITTGVTLEAWINPDSMQYGGIISNDITYSTHKGYDFFLWTGGNYGRIYADFGNGTLLGRVFWDIPSASWYQHWHHVATTYNGSTIRIYVDGVQVATGSFSGTYATPNKETFVGAINYLSPAYYYFDRYIKDVKIWNTALTFPYGVIFGPQVDSVNFGSVNLNALFVDGNTSYSGINWAVRYNSCDANTNTRFGNVDGFNNSYTWDGNNFSATIDTISVTPGHYCFVFNPGSGIRETRWFYIEPLDNDGDGVPNTADKCSETHYDQPDELGVNRHVWSGDDYFKTLIPGPKGVKSQDDSTFSLDDTFGCSCEQILDRVTTEFGTEMLGHYKYGCSKSVLEDWILDWQDGELDGRNYIETVEVKSNSTINTPSSANLISGKKYIFESSGNWINSLNVADTEYASNDAWANYFDGYNISPWSLGVNEFDLMVDGGFIEWGVYNPSHEYSYEYTGMGSPVNFLVFDGDSTVLYPVINTGWYGDNSGSLFVDIYQKIW